MSNNMVDNAEDAELNKIIEASMQNTNLIVQAITSILQKELFRGLSNKLINKYIAKSLTPYIAAAAVLAFMAKDIDKGAIDRIVSASEGKTDFFFSRIVASFDYKNHISYLLMINLILNNAEEPTEDMLIALARILGIHPDFKTISQAILEYQKIRSKSLITPFSFSDDQTKAMYERLSLIINTLMKASSVLTRYYYKNALQNKVIREYALKDKNIPWCLSAAYTLMALNVPLDLGVVKNIGIVLGGKIIRKKMNTALFELNQENYLPYLISIAYLDALDKNMADEKTIMSVLKAIDTQPSLKSINFVRDTYLKIKRALSSEKRLPSLKDRKL